MTGIKALRSAGMVVALALSAVSAWADSVADELNGSLVRRQGENLTLAGPEALAGKTVIALYYSTYGPVCRKFTPQLEQFYRAAIQRFPNFQLVMICRYAPAYRSEEEMIKYIVGAGMDWPILTFGNATDIPLAQKFAANSVPHLVIVDDQGNKLMETEPGEDASARALANLTQLLDAPPSDRPPVVVSAPVPEPTPNGPSAVETPAATVAPTASTVPTAAVGPNDYYLDGNGTEYMPGYQPRGAKLMHRAPSGN